MVNIVPFDYGENNTGKASATVQDRKPSHQYHRIPSTNGQDATLASSDIDDTHLTASKRSPTPSFPTPFPKYIKQQQQQQQPPKQQPTKKRNPVKSLPSLPLPSSSYTPASSTLLRLPSTSSAIKRPLSWHSNHSHTATSTIHRRDNYIVPKHLPTPIPSPSSSSFYTGSINVAPNGINYSGLSGLNYKPKVLIDRGVGGQQGPVEVWVGGKARGEVERWVKDVEAGASEGGLVDDQVMDKMEEDEEMLIDE